MERSRRLPSLRGLQAFEAVVRAGSLAAAGELLGITASAVSHRIRGLEEQLGVALLRRLPKGLALTEAGQRYRRPVEEAFATLARGTAELLGADLSRPLTISVTTEVGVRWLMPRFPRFRAAHPEIETAILSTYRLVDLLAGEADLALRYGAGPWPELQAEPVLRFSVTPVCAPRLAQELKQLDRATALRSSPLIRAGGDEDDWDAWLAAAGLSHLRPARQLRFADYSMAVAAAVAEQGVVLGYLGYIQAETAAGALQPLYDLVVPVAKGYHLVYPADRLADPRVKAFRDWAVAEAAAG